MPYSDEYVQYLEARLADSQNQRKTGHRDVQRLTNTTSNAPVPTRQEIATAQRQAEALARQRNQRSNMTASPNGLARGRQATTTGRAIDGEYDVWPPRLPNSARRYDAGTYAGLEPGVYKVGEDTVRYHGDVPTNQSRATHIPPRAHAAPYQLPPVQQQDSYTEDDIEDEEEEELRTERPKYQRRIHVHWLVFVGVGTIIALTLWIGAAWVTTWWTNTQNDWTYTAQFRTFSMNEVVGHNNDSNAHPSHFIVQNDNRHIIIIEAPANDWSKSIIYSAPTLIGDGQERTPATLSFQLNPQTGRIDMVLHVESQTYLFTNNGVKFVTPQGS